MSPSETETTTVASREFTVPPEPRAPRQFSWRVTCLSLTGLGATRLIR